MTKAFHLLTLFVCPLVPLRGHDSHHTLNHHLITYLFLFVTWLIYVFEKYLQLYLELVWINLTNVWIVNFANNLWSMSSSQFNISLGYFHPAVCKLYWQAAVNVCWGSLAWVQLQSGLSCSLLKSQILPEAQTHVGGEWGLDIWTTAGSLILT